jgi:tryptophan synthase alpha chain
MAEGGKRLGERIEKAAAQGRRALIPFLPAGFPHTETFWDHIRELDHSGADIIEIGVPFSDPVADGEAVEEASQQSLAQGVDLDWIFSGLAGVREEIGAELVLMGYVNPFLQYGWDRLARKMGECRVSGLIAPDLPLEESAGPERMLRENGASLIRLVGVNTSPDRMRRYAEHAEGFVYFVSVLGTTGGDGGLSPELAQGLRQAGEIFDAPLALGFGLSRPEQLEGITERVDAVVFGSALIRHIRDGGSPAEFMARWRE